MLAHQISSGDFWRPVEFPLPLSRPLGLALVHAGFPSPAQDYTEKRLDLNQYLIDNAVSTFFVRSAGDCMRDAGIYNGDILSVDRSKEAQHGSIVIAFVNGERVVRYLRTRDGPIRLEPANPNYSAIIITDDMQFEVWGVVTGAVRKFPG